MRGKFLGGQFTEGMAFETCLEGGLGLWSAEVGEGTPPRMWRQAFLLRLHKYISRGPSSNYANYANLDVFTGPPGRLSPDTG